MWTAKNREWCDRGKLRYPSDVSDEEWTHVEPLIPPAKRGGRKLKTPARKDCVVWARERIGGDDGLARMTAPLTAPLLAIFGVMSRARG